MIRRTKLERRTLAFLRGMCRRVRTALVEHWDNPRMFDAVIDMCRKMTEQVWLATHDPLNILGTAQVRHADPRMHRNGADWCVLHFVTYAGDIFNREFEAGLR